MSSEASSWTLPALYWRLWWELGRARPVVPSLAPLLQSSHASSAASSSGWMGSGHGWFLLQFIFTGLSHTRGYGPKSMEPEARPLKGELFAWHMSELFGVLLHFTADKSPPVLVSHGDYLVPAAGCGWMDYGDEYWVSGCDTRWQGLAGEGLWASSYTFQPWKNEKSLGENLSCYPWCFII